MDAPLVIADLVAAADAARDRRDWPGAAALYARVAALAPIDAGMWTQLGHARREGGDPAAAADAYAAAARAAPGDAEIVFYLGLSLRLAGDRDRAVGALSRAAALRPGYPEPARELAAMGAFAALPPAAARALRDPAETAALLADALSAVRDWRATAGYAASDWDRFRRDIPVRPPPGPLPDAGDLLVLVDARGRPPASLRTTLTGLADQSVRGWRALVAVDDDQPAADPTHPVPPPPPASSPFVLSEARPERPPQASGRRVEAPIPPVPSGPRTPPDPRVAFGSWAVPPRSTVVALDAGCLLHPEALAWMLFALDRTGAPAAFADQDRVRPDPLRGGFRSDPRLFAAFDPDLTLAGGAPALVAGRGILPPAADAASFRRAVLLAAAPRVAHVARMLATVPEAAVPAAPVPPPPRSADRIAVVIPTRDRPDLLARAVAALRATAADPARLSVVAVNNGGPLDPPPGVAVVDMPGPFNWSRANNLGAAAAAAAAADAELLLFLNDDAEVTSPGWDDALAHLLARPHVGAVGARLLYPEGSVQHAGILFAAGEDGRPVHEGRGAAARDPGPGARYRTRRAVAAVTGACLATTRTWLARAGGFDEDLAVAYNDLDFCLRVRAAGGLVLFEPAVEAIHLEGATRGRAASPDAAAWDDAELARLARRWGAALSHDPGVSPYWSGPHRLLREPPPHEVVGHLDRTGAGVAWLPAPPES